jgi:putative heme transporter
MSASGSSDRTRGGALDPATHSSPAQAEADRVAEVVETGDEVEPRFFADPRKIAQTLIAVIVILAAIYLLLPNLVGLEDAFKRLDDGDPVWIAVAVAFSLAMFASYVALFRGVVGEGVRLRWRESYDITMAGLAATRLFSAGGAGGIILTYWALRKAGMPRRQTACRLVAFLVLLYAVYMVTLVVDGVLLRTGVFPGPAPAGLTIVPAAFAGGLIVIFLLIALIPSDFERRIARFTQGYRFRRMMHRLASAPATLASGTRTAIAFVREPSQGGLAVAGAIGFWAANIAILWASFKAFDADIPLAVVVQGFFVGMLANLFPFAPGGVGAVDAGMIGTFALFDVPGVSGATIFAAVLTYRLIAFWLPIPPGIVAFISLRKTVARWERERSRAGVAKDRAESFPGPAGPITSESKVRSG